MTKFLGEFAVSLLIGGSVLALVIGSIVAAFYQPFLVPILLMLAITVVVLSNGWAKS